MTHSYWTDSVTGEIIDVEWETLKQTIIFVLGTDQWDADPNAPMLTPLERAFG